MNRTALDPFPVEQIPLDPTSLARLTEAAHRARARAIQSGFAWLLGRIARGFAPRRTTARWIARLG